MVNEKMRALGATRSVIREMFEYGKKRKSEIGDVNVFDFSIGNPSVPSPGEVNESLIRLLTESDPVALHGYTSAQGDAGVRTALSDYINTTYGDNVSANDFYLTVGAAASLTVTLTALLNEGDEVILIAPFFPEYRVFVERTGANVVIVDSEKDTFQPDIQKIEAAFTERTRAIIVNYPNNPTGAVITDENARSLGELVGRMSEKYQNPVYLISDEPYRELVYDGVTVPYLPKYCDNTIVCYSFSKSLSIPGERIGYIMVSPRCADHGAVYEAVCGAGRALGFVCAPSLFQYMIPHILGKVSDLSVYNENRRLLYSALTDIGYTAVKPDGAFYLFVKSPEADAKAFCERARKYELLLVPSDSFGCGGYVRISYCVRTEQIKRSIPAFRALWESYNN